jgi:hypothetical protein
MAILPKYQPESTRSGSALSRSNYSTRAPEPRPYLVSAQLRRSGAKDKSFLPLFPHESEDARLTGSTRSLYRRLLALNLPKAPPQKEAATTFTGSRIA